jgi:hypothetical protein
MEQTAAEFNIPDTTNMAFGKGPSPQEAVPLPQLAQQTVNSAGLKYVHYLCKFGYLDV